MHGVSKKIVAILRIKIHFVSKIHNEKKKNIKIKGNFTLNP
jgi:hypothetical protein